MPPVQIADESAIIVWDERSHTEHFIRRASFRTAVADFGFLVPTPGVPTLSEVGDAVFDTLEEMVKPEVVYRNTFNGFELSASCLTLTFSKSESVMVSAADSVHVIATQRVAGYDATVLEASDASALAKWLEDHHYAQRPDLAAWLSPYVAARWKLTAFRMAPDGKQATPEGDGPHARDRIDSPAVRMSFATDRPFFPYREPADQRTTVHASLPPNERARALHVFFLGPSRVGGAIGDGSPWPGETRWANTANLTSLAPLLPIALPPGTWLTALRDTASPRPGTDDLFFSPSPDPRPFKPAPTVIDVPYKIPILLDVVVVLCLGGWFVYLKRRRSAA